MKLYCMCARRNNKPDGQAFMAPNRYCAITAQVENNIGKIPPLALRHAMVLVETGVLQVILDSEQNKPNNWGVDSARPDSYKKYYPNVDFYQCQNCGTRIATDNWPKEAT